MRQDCLILPKVGSTELVIAFTSYGGHSVPAGDFEWRNMLAEFDAHQIFLRDSFQHWYHSACLGYTPSLDHTITSLRAYIATHGITKVTTIGSSMGAHGALLYGCLLNTDHCIAIVPQVKIKREFLLHYGDTRWDPKMTEINMIEYPDLDIATLSKRTSPKEALVYFDAANILDAIHANALSGLPNFTIENIGYGDHELAYTMAKQGILTKLLRQRLTVSQL